MKLSDGGGKGLNNNHQKVMKSLWEESGEIATV
jgi:hypothetical protein